MIGTQLDVKDIAKMRQIARGVKTLVDQHFDVRPVQLVRLNDTDSCASLVLNNSEDFQNACLDPSQIRKVLQLTVDAGVLALPETAALLESAQNVRKLTLSGSNFSKLLPWIHTLKKMPFLEKLSFDHFPVRAEDLNVFRK